MRLSGVRWHALSRRSLIRATAGSRDQMTASGHGVAQIAERAAVVAPVVVSAAHRVEPPLPDTRHVHDWEGFRRDAYKAIDAIVDYHSRLNESTLSTSPIAMPSRAPAMSDRISSDKLDAQQIKQPLPVSPRCDRTRLARQLPFVQSLPPPLGCPPGEGRRAPTTRDIDSGVPAEQQLPTSAPIDDLLRDYEGPIRDGMLHWQHPRYLGYFPCMVSPAAIIGELLASSMCQPGFSWAAAPSATELEGIVTDWFAQAMQLPLGFQWRGATRIRADGGSGDDGAGGCGTIQPSATESTTVAMAAALQRLRAVSSAPWKRTREADVRDKAVVYCSDQSHFCVEKAAQLLGIEHVRKIKTGFSPRVDNYPLLPTALHDAMHTDAHKGLVPLFVHLNFGSTGTCAIDPPDELSFVAKSLGAWVHIDAAYGGATALCPEYRPALGTLQHVDSLCVNGSKWLGLMMGSSMLFARDRAAIRDALSATAPYVADASARAAPTAPLPGSTESMLAYGDVTDDLKNFHLGLGRPFNALKFLAVIRLVGVEGLRATVRRHVLLARYFERQLRGGSPEATALLEVVTAADIFGLAVFRIRHAPDGVAEAVVSSLNESGKVYMVTVPCFGATCLRFCPCHPGMSYADVDEVVALLIAHSRRHMTVTM